MTFHRKIMICLAAFAGIGLSAANTAHAQTCKHIGMWTRTPDGIVCSGEYISGNCVWYDDCRKSVE